MTDGRPAAVELPRTAERAELPRVAVLLATYNGARWLPELLESLTRQVGVHVTVFAADDGSNDGTLAVLRAGAAGLDIREIVGPRAGTAARNFARLLSSIDVTAFDFIAFCDQDDIWLPGKLRRAIDVLDSTDADCYGSDLISFDRLDRRARVRKSDPPRRLDHLFQSASAACTYVLRSDAARELADLIAADYRDWTDSVSFDCVIYAASRARGRRWVVDDAAEILYRQHESNVEGANVGVRAVARRAAIVRRGWLRRHVRSLLPYLPPSPEVDAVAARLERGRLGDRLWLAAHAGAFRRDRRARIALRIFFLLGWL